MMVSEAEFRSDPVTAEALQFLETTVAPAVLAVGVVIDVLHVAGVAEHDRRVDDRFMRVGSPQVAHFRRLALAGRDHLAGMVAFRARVTQIARDCRLFAAIDHVVGVVFAGDRDGIRRFRIRGVHERGGILFTAEGDAAGLTVPDQNAHVSYSSVKVVSWKSLGIWVFPWRTINI